MTIFCVLGCVLLFIGSFIILAVCDAYKRNGIIPLLINVFIAILFIILGTKYKNMDHLIASIKYDNVICISYDRRSTNPKDIDPKYIISIEDDPYTCIRTIVYAWNNKDAYDELVSKLNKIENK